MIRDRRSYLLKTAQGMLRQRSSRRSTATIPHSTRYLILTFCLLLTVASSCFAAEFTRSLGEGVTLTQIIRNEGADPQIINILRIDTTNPNVKVESALARGSVLADDPTKGRETVSRLAGRTGALAAVNADYFPFTGDPLGVAIVNGEFVSEPYEGRTAMGISQGGWYLFDKLTFSAEVAAANGKKFKIHGINRLRGLNEVICYTPLFGDVVPDRNACTNAVLSGITFPLSPNKAIEATVQEVVSGAGMAVPADGCVLSANGPGAKFITDNLQPGDRVTLKFDLVSQMGKNWNPVVQAVGGGPWLVVNGQVTVDWAAQKFDGGFAIGRHPRTAVGITEKKELLLVTVDGRQWIGRGMSLNELAELMKSLGAVNAMNLDGGGSTSMSIKGLVVNSPSEGSERPVANALVVRANEPVVDACEIAFSIPELTAQASVGQKLTLMNAATGAELAEPQLSAVVWGTKGGRGFVNQAGHFVPMRPGKGAVTALLGDKTAELSVTVEAGPPTALTASMKDDPTGAPNRGLVDAKVADVVGNGIPGIAVNITVVKGTPDSPSLVTDAKGVASFGITWDSEVPAGRSATVSSAGLASVTVKK